MQLARVVGTCVATVKAPGLRGQRLLVVAPLTFALDPAGDPFVAVDTARAGPGDLVFWVASREAAKALSDPFNPVDAAILGIVDELRYAPWPGGAA